MYEHDLNPETFICGPRAFQYSYADALSEGYLKEFYMKVQIKTNSEEVSKA